MALALILVVVAAACGSTPAANGVATLETPGASASPSGSAGSGAKASGSPDAYQAMLAYSQCMRQHGITKFPDPINEGGGVGLRIAGGPDTGLDPNSSQFQAAQQACQSLMPAAPSGARQGPDPSMQAQALQYSSCMRSHGLPNFPDPQFSNGGMTMKIGGSQVDPNSPQFKAAQQACQSLLPGFAGGTTSGGGSGGTNGNTGSGAQP